MDEAQALADRVAIIVAGEIVAVGAPSELGGRETAASRIRFALPDGEALSALAETPERASKWARLLTLASDVLVIVDYVLALTTTDPDSAPVSSGKASTREVTTSLYDGRKRQLDVHTQDSRPAPSLRGKEWAELERDAAAFQGVGACGSALRQLGGAVPERIGISTRQPMTASGPVPARTFR